MKLRKSAGILSLATLMLYSCSGNKESKGADSDTTVYQVEAFHADNDIAMTVRSIIDAISVGEKLNPTDYDYTGVLTDGTGRPLYTTLDGMPGEWTVKVETPRSVVISNNSAGDLLADDLESYLAQTQQLAAAGMEDGESGEIRGDARVYLFPGGKMKMDVEMEETPAGEEAAMVRIMITRD